MADTRKRSGSKGTTYQVRYARPSSSSGYAYATFNTMKEARAFAQNLGAMKDAPDQIVDVRTAIDRWLDICEKIGRDGREKVEPETLKEYRRRANVMKAYSWTKPVHELVAADIVQFRNWLLETRSRDLARRTLSSFHSVLIEMHRQGVIASDPAIGITVRGGGRYEEDDSAIEIPTDDEVRAIFAAADRMAMKNDYMAEVWARYRPMIYLAGFTGMRPSEYRGLAWAQVAADHITVRQRADATGKIGPVKSRAGRRILYLPAFVSTMLEDWRAHCPPSELGLVFPTSSGRPMALTNFRAGAWDPLMTEAGLTVEMQKAGKVVSIPRYTPYALRHYFASKLIEGGNDLKSIQAAMGHSKIEITFNVYGHLIRGREEKNRQMAEDLAHSVLGTTISCGKSVASALQAAE